MQGRECRFKLDRNEQSGPQMSNDRMRGSREMYLSRIGRSAHDIPRPNTIDGRNNVSSGRLLSDDDFCHSHLYPPMTDQPRSRTDMSFRHGAGLTKAIRETVAAGPVDMAVAFWGTKACERLELPGDLSNYRVVCDARSGFCSPVALGTLLRRGACIVDVRKLHAKVYKSRQAMVVASANASPSGLSLDVEADFGLEAGTLVTATAELEAAAEWLDDLFQAGVPIGPEHIGEISGLWEAQRASRPARYSLIAAIFANADDLADRRLKVYVYTSDRPTPAHIETFKATPLYNAAAWKTLKSYPFFWGTMPRAVKPGDDLLCFEVEDGSVTCEGVWRLGTPVGSGEGMVWPSTLLDQPFGRPLGDVRSIQQRLADAVAAGLISVDKNPMPLTEFADAIADCHYVTDHLGRISTEAARAAYALLVDRAKSLGMQGVYKRGVVPAVEWRDTDGDYLFSFIPNQSHLLFYIRNPALGRAPSLAASAASLGMDARTNPSGETTLRISDASDARRLADWLSAKLPLPRRSR